MIHTCDICGSEVQSSAPASVVRRAEWDLAAHLRTHSVAEIVRHELRQNLDGVPQARRGAIVRDIYRGLLGRGDGAAYTLGTADGLSVYGIDEALGGIAVYELWRRANRCRTAACGQHLS